MQVIFYNSNMFSLTQVIHIYDTEAQEQVFTQLVSADEAVDAICALAKKFNISEIRIGNSQYALPVVEEIKTAYSLNYGNNNINVEVIY